MVFMFEFDWPDFDRARPKPRGTKSLETGQGFFGRPSAGAHGNQALSGISLRPNDTALDALLAHYLLSHHHHASMFHHEHWNSMVFAMLIWDTSAILNIRATAKRFGFIAWQYCHTCQQYKMAGRRTLTNPTSHGTHTGLHEYLVANRDCAGCRMDMGGHTGPAHVHPMSATLPRIFWQGWQDAPRRTTCNRQLSAWGGHNSLECLGYC
jgi:hypothetical protein